MPDDLNTMFATKTFAGRNAQQKAADASQAQSRDQASAAAIQQAQQVWKSGNAGDKAALMKMPIFTNQLKNNPALARQFGFSGAEDVNSTINGLYAGNLGGDLYDSSSDAFERLGGTKGTFQAPSQIGAGGNPAAGGPAPTGAPPTYPLPGAQPGQVPGTSWPSNNMPPGGPQQYFPPPAPNYLSSNNPQGAVYQPTVPGGGGKMGAQPAPQRGKFG